MLWDTHNLFGTVYDFWLYQKVLHEQFFCMLTNMWSVLDCEILFVRYIEISLSYIVSHWSIVICLKWTE